MRKPIEVSIQRRKGGANPRLYWRANGEQHFRTIYPKNDQDAELLRVDMERALNKASGFEQTTVTSTGRATLAETLAAWNQDCAAMRLDKGSLSIQRTNARRLEAVLGSVRISELTDRDVRIAIMGMTDGVGWSQPLSPNTLMVTVQNLMTCMNWAVKRKALAANPLTESGELKADLEKLGLQWRMDHGREERDAWTVNESKLLLSIASAKRWEALHPHIELGLLAGMRIGEILGLQWRNVDLRTGKITVREQWTQRGELKPPKMGKRRTFPISDHLREVLEIAKARSSDDLVAPAPQGGHWSHRNFTRKWNQLRDEAVAQGVRGLVFHCTRHSFITWALETMVPLAVVAAWVGDKPDTIEKNYAHVRPERHPMRFMDALFSEAVPEGTSEVMPNRCQNDATADEDETPDAGDAWIHSGKLERETGFEPATLSLGRYGANHATRCPNCDFPISVASQLPTGSQEPTRTNTESQIVTRTHKNTH